MWQIVQQYPDEFEFNEQLLKFIFHHVYSCRFGTFLYDTERERVAAKLKSRTVSIWTKVNCSEAQQVHIRANQPILLTFIFVDILSGGCEIRAIAIVAHLLRRVSRKGSLLFFGLPLILLFSSFGVSTRSAGRRVLGEECNCFYLQCPTRLVHHFYLPSPLRTL